LTVSSFRATEINSSECQRQWGKENVKITKKRKTDEIFNKPMGIAFG